MTGTPALVLLHGALHAADCWDVVVDELARCAPQLQVLAVDLPGRRGKPGDLITDRLADWVDSIVTDIEAAGLDSVVLVAHSLAGLVAPDVVARLGAPRVRELVLVAAVIPPHGGTALSRLPAFIIPVAKLIAASGTPIRVPYLIGRIMLWNSISRNQRTRAAPKIYPESSAVLVEPVNLSAMPPAVPRTWVMTLRDRTLSPRRQFAGITAIGGVAATICIDTCHDAMFSEPRRVAAILAQRCRAAGASTSCSEPFNMTEGSS